MRIVGDPGTAKTDIVSQVATRAGFGVKVVLASLRDPTDFLGLPVARGDGSMGYAPPDWVVEVARHPYTVVFFDEINTCSPATQAALLRVVLDRVVGDFALPPTVRILAAQNGVDDSAGGYDLAVPLANRFGTLADWKGPPVDEWTSWLVGAGTLSAEVRSASDPEAEQDRVSAAWHAEYARAAGTVGAFVSSKPSMLHARPPSGSPQASMPWPSRRTWSMATRALAASKIYSLTDNEADRYVGSFVGDAAVVELRSFTASLDLPNPADLLDGRVDFKPDNKRMDRTMAVLSSCAAVVVPKDATRRIERAAVLWSIVRRVALDCKMADVAWPTVRLICSKELGLERAGGKVNRDADAVLSRFHPLLEKAGMLRT